MGEIADSILNGDFDEITGEWLGEGDGYPRSLHRGKKDKSSGQLFGIKKFLSNNRISNWQDVIQKYAKEKKWTVKENEAIANEIQKDFSAFVNYVKIGSVINTNLRKQCDKCNCNRSNALTHCAVCGTELREFIVKPPVHNESEEQTAADDHLDYLNSQY